MAVASKKGRTYLYIAAVVTLFIFVGTVQQQSGDHHYPELKEAILENLKTFGRASQNGGLDTSSIDDDDSDFDNPLDNESINFASSSDPDDHPLRKHSASKSSSSRSGAAGGRGSPSSRQYISSGPVGDSLYADDVVGYTRDQPSFYDISIEKGTDKVTMHTYHDMYERYLPALRNRRVKLLEIGGVGCSLDRGPGPSYYTWLEYFPYAELYFIEPPAAAECIDKWRDKLKGARAVVSGDAADAGFLEGFVASLSGGAKDEAGFAFDVIIDGGGHTMAQQLISLQTLWRAVKPGGTYFVEDLETSYLEEYGGGRAAAGTMVQLLQSMTEDLMYPDARMQVYNVHEGQDEAWRRKVQFDEVESVTHIDCSRQICAISKRRD